MKKRKEIVQKRVGESIWLPFVLLEMEHLRCVGKILIQMGDVGYAKYLFQNDHFNTVFHVSSVVLVLYNILSENPKSFRMTNM